MDALQNVDLIDQTETLTPANEVISKYKYIVLYYSASWCVACKSILPILRKIHTESIERLMSLQIIYVCLDSEEYDMKTHFRQNHGAWYAIPFGSPAIEELKLRYGITYIPFLIVLKNDGTIVTMNGKKELEELGVNVLTTWIQ